MHYRPYLVGAAVGLLASVAIASTPAMATPCTNLQSLALQHTTITSAIDNTTGAFVVPGSNPPATLTGLPAFCRVDSDADAHLQLLDQDRGVAAGNHVERTVSRHRRRRVPGYH